MEERDFDLMLEKTASDYLAAAEEAKGSESLTLDMLSDEIKEAMCFDVFPEDIQKDILALSQKLVEYAQAIAFAEAEEEEEAKGGPGGPYFTAGTRPMGAGMSYMPASRYQPSAQQRLSFSEKLFKCARTAPTQISHDAFNNALTVGGLMGLRTPTAPYAFGGALVAGIGTFAAGNLGHMVGCMQRAHFR